MVIKSAPVTAASGKAVPVIVKVAINAPAQQQSLLALRAFCVANPTAALSWPLGGINPRRVGAGTYAAYASYVGAPTVAQYMATGGHPGHLRWDIAHGFVVVAGLPTGVVPSVAK